MLVETCCYYRALYAIASASRQPIVCIAWLSHSSKALDQYKEYKGLYINTLTGEEFTLGP